jgi:2-phosphoglycerate kinase
MENIHWTVLLIGGASGTGKSEVARVVAEHYNIGVIALDDIHYALKPMVSAQRFPAITDAEGHNWKNLGVERNVNWLKAVSKEMAGALGRLVECYLEKNTPVIIEGDFIIPETLKPLLSDKVKGLFVCEGDGEQIVSNYMSREGGEPQVFRAEISVTYNNWIVQECEALGINLLASRPWDTALARAIKILK